MGLAKGSTGCTTTGGHGARVKIGVESRPAWEGGARVYHETWDGKTFPIVRSYKDGVRVGCTFVSTEALEKIRAWHQEFLLSPDAMTHQETQ